MQESAQSLLVITGSMGSGKSSVLAEASDILSLKGVAHAAVDLDALSFGHFPAAPDTSELMYRNLGSIWRNYASAGATRLLLARAMETRVELEVCSKAVSALQVKVCRLMADLPVMESRVRQRELGILQQKFVDRVSVLDALLDRADLEDFRIHNQDRPLNQVAMEMLQHAGWL